MFQRRMFSELVNFSFPSYEKNNNSILLFTPKIVHNREILALFSNRAFLYFKFTFFLKAGKNTK